MKKKMHRLVSWLLTAALLLQVFTTLSFAEEAETDPKDDSNYPYLYLQNYDLKSTILAISFDSVFEAVGGEPMITVSYNETEIEDEQQERKEHVLHIEAESVRREVFEGEDEDALCPQLFIRLPGYMGNGEDCIPETAWLYIGENMFRSPDGSPSPAMKLQLSEFACRKIGVAFRSEKVTIRHHILAKSEIYVHMDHMFDDDFIELWNRNSTFFLDEVPITAEYIWGSRTATVPSKGFHTIRMQLNDFVYTDALHFLAVSRSEARKEQIEELGSVNIWKGIVNQMLSVPLIFAPFIAIPNFFMGVLSVGEGLCGIFLSMFMLYLHTDCFYPGGHIFYGGNTYGVSKWTFS